MNQLSGLPGRLLQWADVRFWALRIDGERGLAFAAEFEPATLPSR